jgi:two-component system, NarL family, response regulator LiaR
MTNIIRVLVVDDHLIVRKGIRALLATKTDIDVVGEARDGAEAVVEAARLQPDVIMMDLIIPQLDGIAAIHQILAHQPQACILVLTSFAGDDQVFPAIRAGALGYILKDIGPLELVNAMRQVYRGESSLDPTIARKVLHELAHPPERPLTAEPLTEREVEVLRLVAQGEATVRKHVSSILSKLQLASRTQAALYALRTGLTSLANQDEIV